VEDHGDDSSKPGCAFATLEASSIPGQSMVRKCEQTEMKAPSPHDWGWILDEEANSWVPVWNTLPVASKACSELVECGCECRWMQC